MQSNTVSVVMATAQAFLFSTEDEALLATNSLSSSYIPTQLEMETWRRKGPLGKLHNIVVYIQRSPQRRSAFQKLSQGRRLLRDNKTRWNSWFLMITSALHEDVKPAIDLYCFQVGTLAGQS
jgi:hypothetical protein